MTEHPNLASALVAALAALTTIDTDRSANMGTYSYKYADLGDIVKETRPVLAEHGIVALTPLGAHDDDLAVTVIFLHASGERIDFGPFPFPHGRDAQATGSMVTYHRRYALLAALGMATGDDDDGAAAQPRERSYSRPQPSGNGSGSSEKRELVQRLTDLGLSTAGDVDALRSRLAEAVETGPEGRDGEVEGVRAAVDAAPSPSRSSRAEQVLSEAGLTKKSAADIAAAHARTGADEKLKAAGG